MSADGELRATRRDQTKAHEKAEAALKKHRRLLTELNKAEAAIKSARRHAT